VSAKPDLGLPEASAQDGTGRWADDPLALPNVRGTRLSLAERRPEIHETVEAARHWIAARPRPWGVDLFSGCGGLGLGLERAGINLVAAADSDAPALETYAANLESLTWCGDLADPEPFLQFLADRGVSGVDVIAGGPPCQPFSRAGSSKIRSLVASGSRPEVDERVDLWRSFAAIIDALSPRAVLLENVPDMATWDDGSVLLDMLQSLRERGFVPEARVLQAERYGVPQHRQRLFVVARRSGVFTWPVESKTPIDLKAAIADLPSIPGGQRDSVLPYDGPQTDFQIAARRSVPDDEGSVIYDHVARAVREDDAEAFELLQPGQTYRDLPERLKRYRDDIFDDKYKRLAWDAVSRSITAHIARDGYWYIHPDQARTLSTREAARIQTFPDTFRFCGHPSVQLRQIGNAVPPALGEVVAKCLVRTLDSKELGVPVRFADLLRNNTEKGNRPRRPGPAHAWRIAVSEVCLGRRPGSTRAETLREVLRVAPTPEAAVAAVAKLSELLGSKKATRLIALATVVVADHRGKMPRDESALRALPGIGLRASGHIRSFGFGEHTVIASEGTRRIVERVTGLSGLSMWTVRLQLLQLCGALGPDPLFNGALLELAEDVCQPTEPTCGSCPVRTECNTAQSRKPSTSPTRVPADQLAA